MAGSAIFNHQLGWTAPIPFQVGPRRDLCPAIPFPKPDLDQDLEMKEPQPSDEELVSAIMGGEPERFQELMERHQGKVLGTASRFTRNLEELEDLGQEIFLKVWKGLHSFRATAPFEHWLMRLTVRVCYDFLRKNRRRRENEISKEYVDGMDQRLTLDPDGNPDLLAQEAREVLHHAMSHLTPKEQLILTLRELERRSVREIAGLTGWTESNVKVRAMRARNRLRDVLIELGYAN